MKDRVRLLCLCKQLDDQTISTTGLLRIEGVSSPGLTLVHGVSICSPFQEVYKATHKELQRFLNIV